MPSRYSSDAPPPVEMCPNWSSAKPLVRLRVAVHPDGRVLETNPIPCPNNDFNRKGRHWHAVEAVPAHAEWIGSYVADMFGKDQASA